MNPLDLPDSAMRQAKSGPSKRPRQADLRRAVSTTYYAYVHAVCRTVADLFIGATAEARSRPEWIQAYKSVEHGRLRSICSNQELMRRFSPAIREFARLLLIAMNKRLLADYDPYASFYRYEVIEDAKTAKDVIRDFMKAPRKERLAFVTLIVLPERKKHS